MSHEHDASPNEDGKGFCECSSCNLLNELIEIVSEEQEEGGAGADSIAQALGGAYAALLHMNPEGAVRLAEVFALGQASTFSQLAALDSAHEEVVAEMEAEAHKQAGGRLS